MAHTPPDHERQVMPAAGANNCLSDEELTNLIEGLELGDRRDILMLHLERCPGCRMVLSEAAQHLSSRRSTSPGSWVRTIAIGAALLAALLALWFVVGS